MTNELQDKLKALIEQYGASAVRKQLTQISGPPKRTTRKTAVHYVAGMSLPAAHKERLLNLAHAFQEGRFLPSLGAIRDLLHSLGKESGEIKGRQTAVPAIFKLLASCPTDLLDRIITQGLYSEPVELAPIAEAIRASATARQADKANDDEAPSSGGKRHSV